MRRKVLSLYEIGTSGHHGKLEVPRDVKERGMDTPSRDTGVARTDPTMDSYHSPFPTHLPLSHTHSGDQLRAMISSDDLAWTAARRRGGRVGGEHFLLWTPIGGRGPGQRCRKQAQAVQPCKRTPPF